MKKNKKAIFKNKFILWAVILIVGIFVISTAFIAGYFVAKNLEKSKKVVVKKDIQTEKALKEFQKLVDREIIKPSSKLPKPSSSEKNISTIINLNSEAVDYAENSKNSLQKNPKKDNKEINKTTIVKIVNKPKLVIIMDDMSFASQVKNLKNLHMKITPSFFPPTYNHPNTAKYAKEFKHYMVHFPMQATNSYFHEEPETLHVDSNYSFIESRVKFIKKNFPNVKFVNNHTGSKFTSNLESMKKLYKALSKYNLIFVDSITTANSKAPIVAKEYHKILLQRDVFLDNFPTMTYIKNQLKFAVKKAEKNEYAIAICHPHKLTFKALKESKNILKNVELIYIGDMYNFAKEHNISRL
jgi:polysaccharide deacetylase 2 family uncharacterized protein YibQ